MENKAEVIHHKSPQSLDQGRERTNNSVSHPLAKAKLTEIFIMTLFLALLLGPCILECSLLAHTPK